MVKLARSLVTAPTFSAVAILTIALAVSANGVAFAVLRTVLNPLPYGNAGQLVALAETDAHTPNPQTASYATARDWTIRSGSFDAVSTFGDTAVRLVRSGAVEMVRGMQVSANFFDTLEVPMSLGRAFRAGEDRRGADHVLVLTHDTWTTLFDGDPEIVGKSISTIAGPYIVTGVLPADFHPLHMSNPAEVPRLFVPYDSAEADCRTAACRKAGVIARLKAGVTAAAAQAELAAITRALAREYAGDYPANESARVTPLREQIVGRFGAAAWLVETAVVLLLALACANVAMLLLARTLSRQAEVAVRAALGATRGRIVRQLMTEGLVLGLVGGAAGAAGAWWATRIVARTTDANVPRIGELAPSGSMLIFAVLVSALVAMVAGVAPALAASRDCFMTMREASGISPRSHQRTVRALVVVELSLAFVLVAIVGLLGRSYLRLLNVNPGFDPEGVVTLSLLPDGVHYPTQPKRLAWFRAVVDRVRTIPGVDDAGYASTLPLSHPSTFPMFIRERPLAANASAPVVDAYLVSANYPDIMRIPVVAGRGFAAADSALTEPVALVSESAARMYFDGRRAIGQHVQIHERRDAGPWPRIVGIVGDVHQYGLDRQADAAVYLLFEQTTPAPQGWASLVVRSRASPERIESAVRSAMRDVDPLQPVFHLQPMTDYVALSVSERTFALVLIGAIAALALALAAGGVYGVVSYVVEQRTREMGLRLALGATAASVRRMIVGQVLTAASVAILCGIVIAAAVGTGLSSLLFGVQPLDAAVLASVAALIVLVALAASAFPVWRASRVDPVVALRGE